MSGERHSHSPQRQNPMAIPSLQSSWALVGALLPLLMGTACRDGASPPLPPEPVIELRSAGPPTLVALRDSVVFELAYTDGNGDIGFADADSAVVYVTDERFPLTEGFHIPPLAPEEAEIAITGVLTIVLPRTILEDPEALSEQVVFSLRLRDRAGNWSNTVQSPALLVLPE